MSIGVVDQKFTFIFHRTIRRIWLATSKCNQNYYEERPINICTKGVDVFDSKDQLLYMIRADCCQIGMWCDAPCDRCQAITFNVQDAHGNVICCPSVRISYN